MASIWPRREATVPPLKPPLTVATRRTSANSRPQAREESACQGRTGSSRTRTSARSGRLMYAPMRRNGRWPPGRTGLRPSDRRSACPPAHRPRPAAGRIARRAPPSTRPPWRTRPARRELRRRSASATTSGHSCAFRGSAARVRSSFSRDRPERAIRTPSYACSAR
jgi:hypothetical protein